MFLQFLLYSKVTQSHYSILQFKKKKEAGRKPTEEMKKRERESSVEMILRDSMNITFPNNTHQGGLGSLDHAS